MIHQARQMVMTPIVSGIEMLQYSQNREGVLESEPPPLLESLESNMDMPSMVPMYSLGMKRAVMTARTFMDDESRV
jgi:ABC-type multidrug transport system ATPase subunit